MIQATYLSSIKSTETSQRLKLLYVDRITVSYA
jgi:hypothetical protein